MVPQPDVVIIPRLGLFPGLWRALLPLILSILHPSVVSSYGINYDGAGLADYGPPRGGAEPPAILDYGPPRSDAEPPAIFPFQNYRQPDLVPSDLAYDDDDAGRSLSLAAQPGFDNDDFNEYDLVGGYLASAPLQQQEQPQQRLQEQLRLGYQPRQQPYDFQMANAGQGGQDADAMFQPPFTAVDQPEAVEVETKVEPNQPAAVAADAPATPSPSLQSASAFPELSPKQKEFAVNPGQEEFYQDKPNFLKFRLEDMEEERARSEEVVQGDEFEDGQDPFAKRARMGVASHLRWDGATQETKEDDFFFTVAVAASTAFAVFGIVGAGYCYRRSIRLRSESEEVEYPAYGVTGPAKDASPASGDRKLAQSAQMYHYQHQKSQMIGSGQLGKAGEQTEGEESEGEDGEAEGDYTVYECPGLASTDEMEVKNPLFDYDPTPKP